jgi:hypothetical protein
LRAFGAVLRQVDLVAFADQQLRGFADIDFVVDDQDAALAAGLMALTFISSGADRFRRHRRRSPAIRAEAGAAAGPVGTSMEPPCS